MKRSATEANLLNSENRQNKIVVRLCSIKIPTSGISLENIVNPDKILDQLLCPICKNLFWDPVQTRCQHLFCKYCINEWIKRSPKCPTCRAFSPNVKHCEIISKVIKEIKIKCQNKGCKETPTYSNYITHLKKCSYRQYECLSEGCNYKGNLKEVKNHCLACKNRIIDCQYCHNPVKYCEFELHSKTVCTQEYECPNCHSKMQRGQYFSQHYDAKGENVNCLKAQVKYYEKKYKKLGQKYKVAERRFKDEKDEMSISFNEKRHKYHKIMNKLNNENNKLRQENVSLRDIVDNDEDSISLLYKKFKERKRNMNSINIDAM